MTITYEPFPWFSGTVWLSTSIISYYSLSIFYQLIFHKKVIFPFCLHLRGTTRVPDGPQSDLRPPMPVVDPHRAQWGYGVVARPPGASFLARTSYGRDIVRSASENFLRLLDIWIQIDVDRPHARLRELDPSLIRQWAELWREFLGFELLLTHLIIPRQFRTCHSQAVFIFY